MVRSRAILAEPPAAVAFDDEDLGPFAGGGGAVDELAGEAEFLGGGLARRLLLLPAAEAFLGAEDEEVEDGARGFRVLPEPCVEVVADRAFGHAGGVLGGEAVLGLAHEGGVGDEAGDERAGAAREVLARDLLGLPVVGELAVGADALEDGGPEPGLVRAAFGRGDGVAVGLDEAVARGRSR